MQKLIKYLFVFCAFSYGLNTYAQGDDCASATIAVLGTNTVVGPLTGAGAEFVCAFPDGPATNAGWYSYTAASNASVTAASCLGGADTRVMITTGACGAQTCVAGNDDACELSPGGNAWASSVTFAALAGTTYNIQWDDRWSASGFDWTLSETVLDCPVLLANIGDVCDFAGVGDGIVDPSCTCVALTEPDCATLLSPLDGAEAPIDAANSNAVLIQWSLNGFQPEDEINIYWAGAGEPFDILGTLPAGSTGANITNVAPGTYTWAAVPVNSVGEAVDCAIFTLIAVIEANGPPDCPTALLTPPNGATDVVLNGDTATLTWTNSLVGEPRGANGIYWGTDPGALAYLGDAAAASETINILGVQQGITYFWSIVPSNGIGEATGCPVFSFTVEGTVDCPALGLNGLNFGMACDDGDANTLFDQVEPDACVCAGIPIPANAVCGGAVAITEGVYTANQIIGGGGAELSCFADGAVNALWFSYTASADGDVTVDSSIDLDEPDTRISIYSGTCAVLACDTLNDDVAVDNFTSSVTFPVVSGETYLIEWDDRWLVGLTPFDFELSFESNNTCITDINQDSFTDGADFSIFLGNFGLPCDGCLTDFDNSGTTDGADFSLFLGNFGLPCP